MNIWRTWFHKRSREMGIGYRVSGVGLGLLASRGLPVVVKQLILLPLILAEQEPIPDT